MTADQRISEWDKLHRSEWSKRMVDAKTPWEQKVLWDYAHNYCTGSGRLSVLIDKIADAGYQPEDEMPEEAFNDCITEMEKEFER